jgi:septal ring factor EnvC (AmiA/AmiB activator)
VILPAHLPVVVDFRPPPCAYCAGQRGIEYATDTGSTVVAAASGVVTFAGQVGGVHYVVVRTPVGVLVTHGLLGSLTVGQGQIVRHGAAIGSSSARLYVGVRVGDKYVDPRRCSVAGPRARAVLVR